MVSFRINVQHFHNLNLNHLTDLALEMLNEKDTLAFARGDNHETGLHVLARKPSNCGCRTLLRYPKHLLHLCKYI